MPKRALQLILLTGQRPGEVIGLPWEELSLSDGMWTLSGNRVKNGMTNLVPLSNLAMRIIERQRAALESQKEKREKRGDKAAPIGFGFHAVTLKKTSP
jgi:integrase